MLIKIFKKTIDLEIEMEGRRNTFIIIIIIIIPNTAVYWDFEAGRVYVRNIHATKKKTKEMYVEISAHYPNK